ncbi:gamma-butyrobetaine dioxygenase-like [Rhopilema esculentum]|uniref:gamma-butyrobetaine dioxygenase-like n=1 Tax=Rhopilema esculentum TaxID=499914 RepID=UPI0031E089DF
MLSTITRHTRTIVKSIHFQHLHWLASNSFCLNKLHCNAYRHTRGISFHTTINYLHLRWDDGDQSKYPFIFLRDNCQCEQCFHVTAMQRTCDVVGNFSVDIKPESTWLSDDGVTMEWEDGHRSSFSFKWLRERMFPKSEKEIGSMSDCGLKPVTWGSELAEKIPKYEFVKVMQDNLVCLAWLESLGTTGLTLLRNNRQKSSEALLQISRRLQCSFTKTHYGEIFTLKNKPAASNVAYTADRLALHTDVLYYQQRPGIQLLHCIEQCKGEGGENYMVDGFKAAEELRLHEPEAFKLLSTIKLTFGDVGADKLGKFFKMSERTIISLDSFGMVDGIAENNAVKGSIIHAPAEQVKKLYEAHDKLVKIFNKPENVVTYKMEEGDTLVFNNNRVLHGRAGFAATSPRHLQGCYLSWDDVYCAIRVLRLAMGKNEIF